jgi:hypothetical protein
MEFLFYLSAKCKLRINDKLKILGTQGHLSLKSYTINGIDHSNKKAPL